MKGAVRILFRAAAAAFSWLSRGETWAAERLADAADWCAERSREPQQPRGP